MEQAPRCAFVIFGISGDLAARKLLPALYTLHQEGALHPESQIIGYARSDYNDTSLQQKMKEAVQKFAKEFDENDWAGLEARVFTMCVVAMMTPQALKLLKTRLMTSSSRIMSFIPRLHPMLTKASW